MSILRDYPYTIQNLFANAGIEGCVTLNEDDMAFFSRVIDPAQRAGNITCTEVEGGFQFRLKA